MRRTIVGALAFALAATLAALVPATGAGAASSTEATYTVTVRNLTDAQYLTPPNWAAHDRGVHVFRRGMAASPGVQAVAENGGVDVLADELMAAIDGTGVGISGVGAEAPIGPGAEATFEFTTDARRFSMVAMVVCTNDGFAGVDAKWLPHRDGTSRTFKVRALDAGTELNTELRADLVPAPFCGEGDGSTMSDPALAENGVITRHKTLRGVGDLDPALDWRGPVAEVTITRNAPDAAYTVELENLTNGQYLTPPNYALHTRAVDVYDRGAPAAPFVQGLAENGDVDGVAAALAEVVDGAGLGVSGVAGDTPIEPGGTRTFDVTGQGDRFSLVSMVVCTNDGFAGVDSKRVPRWSGDTKVFYVRALDAGTELNTELRADLVPAPFCGEGDGSTMSDPALAENGVITRHKTLRGVGDLDPALDWDGPVLKVTDHQALTTR